MNNQYRAVSPGDDPGSGATDKEFGYSGATVCSHDDQVGPENPRGLNDVLSYRCFPLQ